MKVLSVVGNRPQFIKSGPVSVALRDAGVEEVLVHSGQHYDRELSQVFFDELDLGEPRYRLDLQTADPAAIERSMREVLERERPEWVLVYGDTNTTVAGARAAARAGIPIAHVEAGLRSGDLSMPEERNRIEVDAVSALLLAPDERSRETLLAEAVPGEVRVVGDVMADVALRVAPLARERSHALERLGLRPGGYLVATVHREANTRPERLRRIVAGLGRLEERLVFPVHPRTRAALAREGLGLPTIDPLGYLDFAALASQARVVVTDSGGLQKEAYWYGVPCVTMRPSTEWADTVELGANVLVDDDPDRIVAAVRGARLPPDLPPLYGDGHASEQVAAALSASLSPL
jgi:UDP-GlcNAc3NAcA epimerase